MYQKQFIVTLVSLALPALAGCSAKDRCGEKTEMSCVDGVAHWVDDCGAHDETCECGCDESGTSCKSCVCTPDCGGKVCGPDGCGGDCPPGCPAGQVCDVTQGQCTDSCLTQAYKDCHPGPEEGADIRWFDSCGNPEGIAEDCPDQNSACTTDGGQPACVCLPGWTGEECDEEEPVQLDILFVVDNSVSMAGEQFLLAESLDTFFAALEAEGCEQYNVAVVTTGMESQGCPPCSEIITGSCINETGESGRFQDRLGKNEGTPDSSDYTFRTDQTCRVADQESWDTCLYDDSGEEGTVLVGVNGCGYERGLAPVKVALDEMAGTYNAGFLRQDAVLVVVIVTDEEDCGDVGDVSEGVAGAMGNICYYASKGVGPDGETTHPNDPEAKPYRLTPVEETYDFLLGLKDNRQGMVKFAAIVGVSDVDNLSTTKIIYENVGGENRWNVLDACTVPGCTGRYCSAKPGTRYIMLAQMFGIGSDGFLDTICQNDFSGTMERLAGFITSR